MLEFWKQQASGRGRIGACIGMLLFLVLVLLPIRAMALEAVKISREDKALDLTKVGAQSLDESEDISFEFVSPAEVMRQIRQGDFLQALHVASYLLALESLGCFENTSR